MTPPSRRFRYALIASILAHLLVFYNAPSLFRPVAALIGPTRLEIGIQLRNANDGKAATRDFSVAPAGLPFLTAPVGAPVPVAAAPQSSPRQTASPRPASRKRAVVHHDTAPPPQAPPSSFSTGTVVADRREEQAMERETDQVMDRDAVRQYVLALGVQARRFKNYPPLAKLRGEAGVSTIDLEFGVGTPKVLLAHSSGHPLLDEEALSMLRQAAAHTLLPVALQGRSVHISVPVRFDLESE